MKTKTSRSDTPKKADPHQLNASAFDSTSGGVSMAPQPMQLKANCSSPAQLQPAPTKFPWKGTVTGIAKLPLHSKADSKKTSKVADIKKGTEVSVTAKSGAYLKVKAATMTKGVKEGYVKAAHVSGTISKLNRTAAALDGTMNKMWKESFNKDKSKTQEKGCSIVEEKGKIKAKNFTTGSRGSVTINQSIHFGEVFVGDVHTHPYSKSQGSDQGVAFSAGDISNMRGTNCFNGYQQLVEAGNKRFALVVTNDMKADKFFAKNSPADITKAYNTALAAAKGTFQQKVITAVQAVIGANGVHGIRFYGTIDKKKKKFDAM